MYHVFYSIISPSIGLLFSCLPNSHFHHPEKERPQMKTLVHLSHPSTFFNKLQPPLSSPSPDFHSSRIQTRLLISLPKSRQHGVITACLSSNKKFIGNKIEIASENEEENVYKFKEKKELSTNQSIWDQMKKILMFSGPATGIWVSGPLMSLIDTAIIGQGSSIELAALGPGTVLCDNMSHLFMFLSIATSNMVATSLARQEKNEVQHQISILLFVGLTCGIFMLLFTKFFGSRALTAFAGPKNVDLVPVANKYVQIRGLAWPAILVGWVAQSASLGMKDSWGPLKALAVSSVISGIGDVILCSLLGYGIAGAAWATMVSQVIAAYMMINTLTKKGYNPFAITLPSSTDLLTVFALAAPVFVKMISKVAFYALITYFATSMGTHTVAAHQVMIQIYIICAVCGEPLSQTAQSFMPELMYGINRSLTKARMLLKSLLIIGGVLGLALGILGTSVPLFFPGIFTPDKKVAEEMHKVLVPYFIALVVTLCNHCLEGTLLAGRELKFISLTFSGSFALGAILLMLVSTRGYGLTGCWWTLVAFHCGRCLLSVLRLLSPESILYSQDLSRYKLGIAEA